MFNLFNKSYYKLLTNTLDMEIYRDTSLERDREKVNCITSQEEFFDKDNAREKCVPTSNTII